MTFWAACFHFCLSWLRFEASRLRKERYPMDSKYRKVFAPINSQSVVATVIDSITNAIIAGHFRPGDKLPTETDLCNMLQVSRTSIREAIKVLVYMGILVIKHPEGTYVASGFSDSMLNPLVYGMMLETSDNQSMIELRRMLEISILDLAIQKATPEDQEEVRLKCDQFISLLTRSDADIDQLVQADMEFHSSITDAAKNPLIKHVYDAIIKLTIPSRRKTTIIQMENRSSFLIDIHRQMYDILLKRQTHLVGETIDKHYLSWKHLLMQEESKKQA